MYTAESVLARRDALIAQGASKAAIIRTLAPMCTGWPYVFGAWGCKCTPANRRKYADQCRAKHPDYADKITNACPVLSGKQSACDGCKWACGVLCFDCRGYTHWILEQVGLQLYGNTVSTQWETRSNWAVQGDIDSLPDNLVCCIFRSGHTGMYLGGGATSDCSTSVRAGTMPGTPKWLRWGIPAGLYTDEELRKAGISVDEGKNVPTLRRGASGERVKWLQLMLNEEMGAGLDPDGVFGAKTEAAVKAFQKAHGLAVDGVCGPLTWAALEACEDRPVEKPPEDSPGDAQEPDIDPAEPDTPDAHPPDAVTMSLEDFQAIKAAVAVLAAVMRKYE